MATAEKPKGKPQLPQGNLDDIDDSKTEYSPGSKADQTIQPGSLQAELQKVVHPGGSAKDRKGASNLESEKSSSQQETKDFQEFRSSERTWTKILSCNQKGLLSSPA